jgi:uncharacterized protein YodC (DUF2158 family)
VRASLHRGLGPYRARHRGKRGGRRVALVTRQPATGTGWHLAQPVKADFTTTSVGCKSIGGCVAAAARDDRDMTFRTGDQVQVQRGGNPAQKFTAATVTALARDERPVGSGDWIGGAECAVACWCTSYSHEDGLALCLLPLISSPPR